MTIGKVGIIGAGTMGAGIAAHLANADVPVVLLDIVTPGLSADEQHVPEARNRFVKEQFRRMVESKPPQLAREDRAALITLGNVEDDFHLLAACDWVIEVIIEKLEAKQALMERLEAVCSPDAIISSNTSGIPIAQIAAHRSEDFKRRFLGTHFFNPPRYLKLLEVIPAQATSPDVVQTISAFGRDVLGKGVVICKDTPNFIANRFGTVTGAFIADYALSNGYTVAEVDALLGPLIGRPKTGFFRLGDLVGVDLRAGIMRNLYPLIPDDPYRDVLHSATTLKVYDRMIENGWLGNKSGQGFYKKVMLDGQREFWTLNPDTFEYELAPSVAFASVQAAQGIKPLPERLSALFEHDDRGADLVRQVVYHMLAYAAYIAPQVAYSLYDIDNAVRWGFNHQMGPFELWDVLGVPETTARLQAHGFEVAPWVRAMLDAGHTHFYGDGTHYDFNGGEYIPNPVAPKHITVHSLNATVASNDSATLRDMGDGVLLFEFHTKVNALDFDIFEMGYTALERLQTDFDALVIGNEGRHFSIGANLGKAGSGNEWEAAASRIRKGQEFMMALRHAPRPVVTALHGRALGGGAEIAMQGWRSVAAHELVIGLVEFNVGLVPAWTGCKELLRRRVNPVAREDEGKVLAVLRDLLRQLMSAQVSSSAWEAKTLGYLRESDSIMMNADHRLYAAKQMALALSADDKPETEMIYAAGKPALDALTSDLDTQHVNGSISAYDRQIGAALTRILCGGDAPQWVDPWHILDLEREASLSLRDNPQTLARIEHMLKTGKPLHN